MCGSFHKKGIVVNVMSIKWKCLLMKSQCLCLLHKNIMHKNIIKLLDM